MVAHYIDLDMSYTTVRNHGQAGLYVLSGTAYPFNNNLVIDNGLAQTYRDGIEVKSSGILYMHGEYMSSGYNKVAANADDQISNYGDLIVGIQSGVNHISGDYSGGKYLIGNYSGTTVEAYYNYWGEPSSNPDMFYGPVSHSSMSSYYPVTHGHNGQAPSKVRTEEGLRTLEDFTDAYAIAESKLGEAETSQELRDELYALYILAGMADDIGLKERFSRLVQGAASGTIQVHNTASKNKIFQDYAKILYTKSLLRDERYDAADAFLKGLEPSILEGHDKSDYWYLKMTTETYHGEYESAWESLQSYYMLQEAQGRNMEEIRASNSPIEEDILARAEGSLEDKMTQTKEVGLESGLLQAYPNPFNPTTNISFSLSRQTRVSLKIYDVLGREVVELVNGVRDAGEYTATFNASRLSSGIYIYQLKVGNQIFTKKMTLLK
jgi:hypothetical protein